jgi:hypothetical protein
MSCIFAQYFDLPTAFTEELIASRASLLERFLFKIADSVVSDTIGMLLCTLAILCLKTYRHVSVVDTLAFLLIWIEDIVAQVRDTALEVGAT